MLSKNIKKFKVTVAGNLAPLPIPHPNPACSIKF